MSHCITLQGSCLCGAVHYEINGAILSAEYCHCSMCRKAHGAAFSANGLVAASDFRILSGADSISEYASSPMRRKCFCKHCGSQLFIRRLNAAEHLVITLGTLDSDPGVQPGRHVFMDSGANWHDMDAHLPRYRIYPGYEPEDKHEVKTDTAAYP